MNDYYSFRITAMELALRFFEETAGRDYSVGTVDIERWAERIVHFIEYGSFPEDAE